MKIIIVQSCSIKALPPTITLINSLISLGYELVLIAGEVELLPDNIKHNDQVKTVRLPDVEKGNLILKLINKVKTIAFIRKAVKDNTKAEDIIWTTTDDTVMYVGGALLKYRHIMQIMELIESIYFTHRLPFIKFPIKKYAQNAACTVVPEFNRAFIQKAWWELDKLPFVLPNKQYIHGRKKKTEISDVKVKKIIEELSDKKICLYQGSFGPDRRLEEFLEAVEKMGDDYTVVLMGEENDYLRKLLNDYPKSKHIPFIKPPNHLEVTSCAYIGILSYIDKKLMHYSPLNAVYCAPNKLYEFSGFGIPMIGNSIPGLIIPFERYGIGVCADRLDPQSICEAISKIESDYEKYEKNCNDFFELIELDDRVREIIETAKKIRMEENK